jgi:hypothetical protein
MDTIDGLAGPIRPVWRAVKDSLGIIVDNTSYVGIRTVGGEDLQDQWGP